MQNKNKLFIPLPLSVMLKLQKIEEYKALTPEEIVARLIEEKIRNAGR